MVAKKILHLSLAFCLATATSWPAARADNINLPDLGDESAAVISPSQERKLGEDFMRRARSTLAFVDDPELNGYIQSLGQKLVSHSDTPQKEFKFFLVSDQSINAFAVPGGFVGVHTGLILATQSEGELASVLAHETVHVTQRHIPRLIAESQRTTLPAMAAILASILLAGSGHGQGAEAGIALTTAAVAQKGINYTRSFEEEADRIGMQVLTRAGFDPRAMPAFFERMQVLNRHNESSLPEFLRTHPVTINRIADARNRAERYPSPPTPDSGEFHHVRAKLRALAPGDPKEIIRGFRDNLAQGKYRDADAERYGYTLALLRDRQYTQARGEINRLVERHPQRPVYRVAQAEIEMAAGNRQEALAIYAAAHKRTPANAILQRRYAEALLKAGKPQAARNLLKTALRQQTDDPALYKLMAQAAGAAGKPLEAHQALAEHYYLNGNPKAAIEQLRIAARYAGDNFYVQSSLEARTNAIKEELAIFQGKK
jgi:predicted Zn-dependent protease